MPTSIMVTIAKSAFHHTLLSFHLLISLLATAQSISLSLFRPGANNMTESTAQLRPIVFCGPSGVGKGTLIEMLMQRFPNDQFGFSVSHTTRAPRDGEVNGVHYHFTTVDAINEEIADGKFIEYAEVHGRYYGTRYEPYNAKRHTDDILQCHVSLAWNHYT